MNQPISIENTIYDDSPTKTEESKLLFCFSTVFSIEKYFYITNFAGLDAFLNFCPPRFCDFQKIS